MRIARCKAGSNINVKNREKLLQDACHKSFENSNVSMEMYRKELLTILQCSFRSPGFNVALLLSQWSEESKIIRKLSTT